MHLASLQNSPLQLIYTILVLPLPSTESRIHSQLQDGVCGLVPTSYCFLLLTCSVQKTVLGGVTVLS